MAQEPLLAHRLSMLRTYTYADFRMVVLELTSASLSSKVSEGSQSHSVPPMPMGWPVAGAGAGGGADAAKLGMEHLYASYLGFSGNVSNQTMIDNPEDHAVGSFDDLD